MANYSYDEGGNMAAYFIITFLALILIPLTLSISPSNKKSLVGCQCNLCVQQRSRISKREKGSIFNPQFSTKSIFIVCGWAVFAFFSWKVANAKMDNKIYDPFEILGLSMSATEKEIKSHYKKLSKLYHPDKVKASVNQSIEEIQNKFVDLTKAYKSLTDETIRENLRKYGNPDGPQQTSVGIALPKWIVESKNNVWVLGVYGLIFGGALPTLVGRWWFGSRQKTKDGVKASSAAAFFKSLKEDSTMEDVVGTLGQAYKWESYQTKNKAGDAAELDRLEKNIALTAPKHWEMLRTVIDAGKNVDQRKAMILVYAHLLRLDVESPSLQKEQTRILLQTPVLLNALLNISISRNWLIPTIYIMRLHGYLAQALLPRASPAKQDQLSQLPGITSEDVLKADNLAEVVNELEANNDIRAENVRKAVAQWGRLELVDAAYKVIGERIIVPSSIVYLTVKLRLSPPSSSTAVAKKESTADEVKRSVKINEQKDEEFLLSRNDAENSEDEGMWAHAPYWPENRKPSWWLILADDKNSRVVVPPMKISNVPFSNPSAGDRDYRMYKLQFQAPQAPGMYTWKIYLVSDTFVGEEVARNMTLKIDDVSALNADEQPSEDEISDPDEDSLAGQMTAMRGGKVKKGASRDEESDDESSTDDDQDSGDDSSSDSD